MSVMGKPNRIPSIKHSMIDAAAQNAPNDRSVHAADVGFGFDVPVAAAVSTGDAAAYLADMLNELRAIAQQSGFETLGRVLEIAEREAKFRMESQQ